MVLSHKKISCNQNTMIAATLAISFLSLFVFTWQTTSIYQLAFEAMLSLAITALVMVEVKSKRGQLIHGAIMVVATLPWVFYLLMALVCGIIY